MFQGPGNCSYCYWNADTVAHSCSESGIRLCLGCNTLYIVSELIPREYTNKVELIIRKSCTIIFMLYNFHCGGSAWLYVLLWTNAHLEQPMGGYSSFTVLTIQVTCEWGYGPVCANLCCLMNYRTQRQYKLSSRGAWVQPGLKYKPWNGLTRASQPTFKKSWLKTPKQCEMYITYWKN